MFESSPGRALFVAVARDIGLDPNQRGAGIVVAETLGVPASVISRWRTGGGTVMSCTRMFDIANEYNLVFVCGPKGWTVRAPES